MVCCVSTEKRKQEVNPLMSVAQGTKLSLATLAGSKSPWREKVRYHTPANNSQLQIKMAFVNIKAKNFVQIHYKLDTVTPWEI